MNSMGVYMIRLALCVIISGAAGLCDAKKLGDGLLYRPSMMVIGDVF